MKQYDEYIIFMLISIKIVHTVNRKFFNLCTQEDEVAKATLDNFLEGLSELDLITKRQIKIVKKDAKQHIKNVEQKNYVEYLPLVMDAIQNNIKTIKKMVKNDGYIFSDLNKQNYEQHLLEVDNMLEELTKKAMKIDYVNKKELEDFERYLLSTIG